MNDRPRMPVVLENSFWGDQNIQLSSVRQIDAQLAEHARSRYMMRKQGWRLPDPDHRWAQMRRNTNRLLDARLMFEALAAWETASWGQWEPVVYSELGIPELAGEPVEVAA